MILPQFEEIKKFSVKHDLIIGRDMPETCRQKKSNKRLGLVEIVIFPYTQQIFLSTKFLK